MTSKQVKIVALTDKSSIGLRLRAERKRLGLTQQALAEAMGVQRQAVFAYEAGKQTPDAVKLAAFFRLGGDAEFVISGRRSDELSKPFKLELERAIEVAEKMCRDSEVSFTLVQELRLAFEILESQRREKGLSTKGA